MAQMTPGAELCTKCGMCCEGTLFGWVPLKNDAEIEQVTRHGIPVTLGKKQSRFRLPCTALEPTGCSIYSDRPSICRSYRCKLLQSLEQHLTSLEQAVDVVAQIRAAEDEVRSLLAEQVVDHRDPIPILFKRFADENAEQFNSPQFRRTHAELLMRHAHFAHQLSTNIHKHQDTATAESDSA